jgi:hypothetical protein
MRIEFDPTNPTEAAAVRAMLTAMVAPETPWIAKRYVMTATGDADLSIKGEGWEEPTLAPTGAETDPWHQGTTVQREAIPTGVTDDGWQTVEAGPATDSTGTPWDERIHSTPATTNKDGTWRAKRGVTADQIAQVRAEREADAVIDGAGVDGHAPAPAGEISAAFEEPVTAPLAEPAVSAPAAPPAPPVNAPSSTPTPAPTPPAPPAPAGTKPTSEPVAATTSPSFLDVMKAITAAQKDGKIDTAKVKELCAAVGAGESTMGLNGPDNGDKRVAFMALLAEETK